jgi:diguanylate cyclase (GGDEF)-like protein
MLKKSIGGKRVHKTRERRTSQIDPAQPERVANFDVLTGVANRTRFQDLLQQTLAGAGAAAQLVAKIDIGCFHALNTSYGYAVGDALLVAVARRLTQLPQNLTARLDADVFAVALPINVEGGTDAQLDALRLALSGPYELLGVTREVQFSIGYTVAHSGSDTRTLLRQTTIALRDCKSIRSREPRQYDAAADERLREQQRVTADLQDAITSNEFVMYYQPKIHLDTDTIVGAEALLRWRHPTRGLLPPSHFIDLSEQAGLIIDIGTGVMQAAARFSVDINQRHSETLHIAVNVSLSQFTHKGMIQAVERLMVKTGVQPECLMLELTENLFAENSRELLKTFQRLRSLGLGLSIDDFGTGYASLRYLDRFPVSEVKIGRDFIRGLSHSRYHRSIIESIVHIAESLRIVVTAEGVETEVQRDLVRNLGCDYAQGYLFSRPLTARGFIRYLQRNLVLPAPVDVVHIGDATQKVGSTAGGNHLPVELLPQDIACAGGRGVVTALRHLRERREAEEKIRFLAHHDVLTGLPNRTQLHDLIAWQLNHSQRVGDPIAVMCIDLDRFKAVNDTHGHQAGDRLLQLVAERILASVRTGDAAARIGGDEFIVLLTLIARRDSITQLAQRLIEQLSEPFDLGGYEARIGASIGIAVSPQHGTVAEVLIKNADIALYRAKADGRGGFCFFETGMDRQMQERRALEQELRQAVADVAFEVVFQPEFDLQTNEINVLEALVRWPRPGLRPIAPTEFIAVAEETGLIVPLGRWVLEVACRAALSWPEHCRVAVNVSARQFVGGTFAETVAEVLARTGLSADRLELEVTETGLMRDPEQVRRSLESLKNMGARIALDDFGTGYSSLSCLQRFPFDKVKIDRSFVHTLADRESDGARAIVGAILAMSHRLGLVVTAEGLETTAQLAMLRLYNCDLVQGHLLARPMCLEQVPGYLVAQQLKLPVR